MNHDESIVTLFLRGGPLQHLLAALIVILGIYHFALSLRILLRRRPPVSAAFHALLLFASPAIVILLVFILIPGALPLSISRWEHEPLRHALAQTIFFGGLSLLTFVPNLVLAVFALFRSERSA